MAHRERPLTTALGWRLPSWLLDIGPEVVAEARYGREAIAAARATRPDVILKRAAGRTVTRDMWGPGARRGRELSPRRGRPATSRR